ncbi:MAG TPA: aldo/keto reductase [Firmicutes bacterium]|nr:aldo/keto reductase [Bacillota bacterium]
MKKIMMGHSELQSSQIALGCMTLGGSWDDTNPSKEVVKTALTAIETALEAGINLFDHADIYTRGKSEKVFSEIWETNLTTREEIVIQSKCGIRFANDLFAGSAAHYDFSYEHIISSVDQILKRLKTEYLDVLLLHRPDALVEPEEVAKAFNELKHQGKVREFGVSNHNAAQISYLQSFLDVPLVVNQMEMSLLNSQLIDEGMNVNSLANPFEMRSNGTLEYCRQHHITLQAWSPLAGGQLSTKNVTQRYEKLSQLIALYGALYGVDEEAIIIAWLLRHPAHIQPIIGTRSPQRIIAAAKGESVALTREQWYALYQAVDHRKLL